MNEDVNDGFSVKLQNFEIFLSKLFEFLWFSGFHVKSQRWIKSLISYGNFSRDFYYPNKNLKGIKFVFQSFPLATRLHLSGRLFKVVSSQKLDEPDSKVKHLCILVNMFPVPSDIIYLYVFTFFRKPKFIFEICLFGIILYQSAVDYS